MIEKIYHPITGDIVRHSGDYSAVLDVDGITVYEIDKESLIVTDIYDRVLFPNVIFSDLNLRLNPDGSPCALELWKDDPDGGVHTCVWYHLF